MKLRAPIFGLVLVLLLVVAGPAEAGDALSVNGVTVSSAELALARAWAKLEAPYQASDDATATALAVDKVVADILLAGEATAAGETLGNKEVKEGESPDAEAKARERIDAAAARIAAGEDFGAVARTVSEDLSRQIGGEIGWVSRGAIPGPMEDLVWRLDTGETSGVLRGPYGFALIQVVDRRPAGPSPFEEVRDSVISDLEADRTAQAVEATVAELRSKATITVLDRSLSWPPR